MLFVSHNLAAVLNLCPRSILLRGGVLAAEGPSEKIVADYLAGIAAEPRAELDEKVERVGNGRVRFRTLGLEDLAGRPVAGVPVGEGCQITLRYESEAGFTPRNVEIGVAFISLLGVRVVMFSNLVAGHTLAELPPAGRVRLRIPSLPLAEGEYSVGISFSCNGETNDWIERAAAVTVHPRDFYGSGRQYRPGSTLLYLPHAWEVL